jgi:hypothetical protein
MGKSSSARVKSRHPVTWDRNTKAIAPVVGDNANDDAAAVITILTNGVASVSVTLDPKELIKQGGRVDHALPVAAESIQLLDSKNPLWAPQQVRVVQLAVAGHDENLDAFVGRAVQLDVSGKNEKIAGVIESVSAKAIVLCGTATGLVLVDRAQVVAASLPGLVGRSVVATLGATADDFAPVLTYTLPSGQIAVHAHYNVELDRSDGHVVVVGSWVVSNRSTRAFDRARVFVERALEPPRVEPHLYSNKMSNSIFSSVSKVKNNNTNISSNRMNRRNSNSSDDDEDGDSSLGVVRFQVPGLVDLPIESDANATTLSVLFGSAKVACVVHNVVEFPKKTKVDAQHSDSAQAQFGVEFALAVEAFGAAVPGGRATLWRAAHKSEPRRLITSITDRVHIPTAMLPHYVLLSTKFAVTVERTVSPLKLLSPSGDVESGEVVVAEQTIKFEFRNNVLEKGATLAIVDDDLEHYKRREPVPTSTRVTSKSSRDGSTVIKESDVSIVPHALNPLSLVLTVPILSRQAGQYELTYKMQYQVESDDNGDGTSSTNDDGTAQKSSSSSGGSKNNNSANNSNTKTRVEKQKKSSWW